LCVAGKLLLSLGRMEQAAEVYANLLRRNGDRVEYIRGSGGPHRPPRSPWRLLVPPGKDFLQAKGVTEWPVDGALPAASAERFVAALDEVQAVHPRAVLPARTALDAAVGAHGRCALATALNVSAAGEQFERRADAYVRARLERGIPSLFADLKGLYKAADKVPVLQRLFEGYVAALRAGGRFPLADPACASRR
jgi:peptide alpha-N-acetyltransferase